MSAATFLPIAKGHASPPGVWPFAFVLPAKAHRLLAYQEELKKSPEQQREQELRQGLALLQRQLVIEQAAAREVVQKHMMAQIAAWKADKPKVAVIAKQNLLAALPKVTITPKQDVTEQKADANPQDRKGGKAGKK